MRTKRSGGRHPKKERYDFVIVGGGPNGVALAAYLGKGVGSVCVLEERPEAGGACENPEPIPGVRITPHAMYMYAGPAPGFEQLELHKYGFRMDWSPQSKNLAEQQGMSPICRYIRSTSPMCGPRNYST